MWRWKGGLNKQKQNLVIDTITISLSLILVMFYKFRKLSKLWITKLKPRIGVRIYICSTISVAHLRELLSFCNVVLDDKRKKYMKEMIVCQNTIWIGTWNLSPTGSAKLLNKVLKMFQSMGIYCIATE